MISLFGYTFGAVYPWLLLGLPIFTVFLIYVYKRKGLGKKIVVSSILILQAIRSKSEQRTKFIPPLRFFIELIIGFALISALAGLYEKDANNRVALLVDNSFSMGSVKNSDHKSSLSLAKEEALRLSDELSINSKVELYETSPVLKKINGGIKAGIENIKLALAADNLEVSLNKLRAADRYTTIYVFSDKLSESAEKEEQVKFVPLFEFDGRVKSNLAIADVAVLPSHQVQVTLVSYSDYETETTVRGEAYIKQADNIRTENLGSKTIKLFPNKKERLNFSVPAEAVGFVATLEANGQRDTLDMLKEDNQGWLALDYQQTKAALVSNLTPKDLGLDKIKFLQFIHIKPAEYSADDPLIKNVKFIIFHREVTQNPATNNALYIIPPNSTWLSSNKSQNAEITSWENSHSLMKYVNVPALQKVAVHPLNNTVGLREVIHSNVGTALSAGEVNGKRIIACGFEILPYEGKDAPLMTILTLNMFSWLAEGNINLGYLPVYSRLVDSSGDNFKASYLNEDDSAADVLSKSGLIQIENGHDVNYIAVNYFDETESNITQNQKVVLDEIKFKQSEDTEDQHSLLIYLISLALILLCFDSLRILFTKGV